MMLPLIPPALVAIAGAVTYVESHHPSFRELGRLAFLAGAIAACFAASSLRL